MLPVSRAGGAEAEAAVQNPHLYSDSAALSLMRLFNPKHT